MRLWGGGSGSRGGSGDPQDMCPVTLLEDWRVALVFTVISAVSFLFLLHESHQEGEGHAEEHAEEHGEEVSSDKRSEKKQRTFAALYLKGISLGISVVSLCLAVLLSNNTCKYYNVGVLRWVLSVCTICLSAWIHGISMRDSLSENAMKSTLVSAIMLLTAIIKLGLATRSVRIVFERRDRRKRSSRLSTNGSHKPSASKGP